MVSDFENNVSSPILITTLIMLPIYKNRKPSIYWTVVNVDPSSPFYGLLGEGKKTLKEVSYQ